MIGRYLNRTGKGVVEMGECDFVFGSDLLSDDDLVDVVEFVPIFIKCFHISIPECSVSTLPNKERRVPDSQRLEFGTTWDSQVESFGREERLLVEEIARIVVRVVGQ